jgi:dihydrofolate reductase
MGRLIVVQFITLDGVVEDPDGRGGTPFGGWAMRFGPAAIAGDRFGVAPVLESGVLLLGRRTWEHFGALWPHRDDDFSTAMNRADKAVVSQGDIDTASWSNSRAVHGPLAAWATETLATRDIVVIGSGSVISRLAESDLVDEYRLLVFPTAVGAGRRLFPDGMELELVSAAPSGPATLSVYSTRNTA